MSYVSILRQLRSIHPVVRTLLLGALMSRLALSMTTPFLTIYLLKVTSLHIGTVGLVVGGASVAGMIGGLFAGVLADRYGRDNIMLLALYTWVSVFLLFATVHLTWVLVVLTLLNGACRSVFEPVSQVLISDLTPAEDRYRTFSLRYTAANIGFSVGPFIGAWLGMTTNIGAFVFASAMFFLYSGILHRGLRRANARPHAGNSVNTTITRTPFKVVAKVLVSDKALCYFLMAGMISRSAYEQVNTNLSIHFEHHVAHGLALFAWSLSANALTVVLLQVPISKWAEGKPLITSIVVGNLSYAVGFIGLAFGKSWGVALASIVVFTIGEILTFPAGTLFLDKIAPDNMRGAYYGTKNVLDLGKFFGPWLGGVAMAAWGGVTMLCIMAVIVLSSTLLYRTGVGYSARGASTSTVETAHT